MNSIEGGLHAGDAEGIRFFKYENGYCILCWKGENIVLGVCQI